MEVLMPLLTIAGVGAVLAAIAGEIEKLMPAIAICVVIVIGLQLLASGGGDDSPAGPEYKTVASVSPDRYSTPDGYVFSGRYTDVGVPIFQRADR